MSSLGYQRYRGILRFRYLPYRLDQVFSDVIPAIPTIPRYFEISVPTLPARSGIFRCHTHDTHAYPGMEYPGYIPGVCRVRYLTHGFCEKFVLGRLLCAEIWIFVRLGSGQIPENQIPEIRIPVFTLCAQSVRHNCETALSAGSFSVLMHEAEEGAGDK